jgi:membrane protein DedA with SNARE-associated domain
MENRKLSIPKIICVILPLIAAIVIFSLTIGRELYADRTQSIQSFAFIHFSGYLFFLLMPVEMAFIYYLSFFDSAQLIAIAFLTAIAAQIIDYFIGLSFSSKFIHYFVGEKRIQKAEKNIQKYGMLTIFVFNLFPLSSPIIALVAGMLKFRFRDVMIYSVAGLLIKYLVLSLIF